MNALDYSFCLRVGEAICPQEDIESFCTALGQVFTDTFPDAHCQLLIAEDGDTQWQLLAEMSSDCSNVYTPATSTDIRFNELLNRLLLSSELRIQSDRFHQLLRLTVRGKNYGYFVLSLPETINIDGHSLDMLSLLISGALDSLLQYEACIEEQVAHRQTEQKRVQEVCSQKGLLEQLHILHKISLRLWHAHSLDNMLHTAVYECIHALELDRMAIFLLNTRTGLMRGTYGTDIDGSVTNEQWYCTAIHEHFHAKTTLDRRKHITINDNSPLYHDSKEVGIGWNATISLWDGDDPIGWIACDNLITGTPLKSYHSELLKLLGVTMSQHLIQRRAQDELKALNLSLEHRVAERTAQLEEANIRLNRISREDSLTMVPNRRMLDEKMEEEWRRALRHQTPMSILIVDIDHFKQYNDKYGHSLGDKCLYEVAKALNNVDRRAGTVLARFGGEEFVYLLPNCDRDAAAVVAERALQAIRDIKITHEQSPVAPYVTVSIGGKSAIPNKINAQQQLFTDADVALYEAKSKGKNQAFVL
ncbi:diguanylate cyclase [Enterovibrio sp. ZSDZ35]|uniref:diguanylate cyclase n=1 Tax=Enterovibrio qingdaonensis TaxID=2899818 RepID=A0ABT5QKD8_9GAMM|nr:diguanylate cyclase [Enterovibrio sp. ZSDZ35]MDD1781324.1 diguanylate cyclase [Enterovibrio sp. ZSDZ35]